MAAAKPHVSSRDPEKLFELMEQIGSGSYGSVHKVRAHSVILLFHEPPCKASFVPQRSMP